ncbi:MAG: phosphoenolpyruvate carboxykinase (ATP) [Planctomycetaceae bacterium]|jgi:phosphoenolpyruvate carboxykinase (ATP)|nr:phosphoenolpyruvate carboxykinase (ATP) [Planctomycetaceae bacterium]
MSGSLNLKHLGLSVSDIRRNLSPAALYEDAIASGDAAIVSSGGLATESGEKTGRSPKDKRVVEHPSSASDVWWGDVNIPLSKESFAANRQGAIEHLNTRPDLYVLDGYAGWDPRHRLKIRIICESAYHALFMHNMLIRPSLEELSDFGDPDYVIFNAGRGSADPDTPGMTSPTSVCLNFEQREFVILGTQYAGEMKKGVFTIMNYLMPKMGVLSMHCSANEGNSGDVSLFFGLSGTGKTTLSADPRRALIGDDEHCWTDEGVFNIEGGCYAKAINLSADKEPEIFQAVRFGSVVENVVFDKTTRKVDYDNASLTENTRISYPIDFIPNAKIPCVGGHPKNVIFLTCDAFGVFPPVSKLTPEQARYYFITGYTAKVAGTEMGVTEPQATFSPCFGAAFLVWHPNKYASMLADKLREHGSEAWLVNTGWSGGGSGVGKRMDLKYTRAIIDAIHDGSLAATETLEDEVFGLQVPTTCPGVPTELLTPKTTWQDRSEYEAAARRLVESFKENHAKYAATPVPLLGEQQMRTYQEQGCHP